MARKKESRVCAMCRGVTEAFFREPLDGIPFVCMNCRCEDCHIVFSVNCPCGKVHGKRDRKQKKLCTECVDMREIVSDMDPEIAANRLEEQAREEPIYR